MGRELFSLLQESRALSCVAVFLWIQMPLPWASFPSFFSPQLYMLPTAVCNHGTICLGYPMGQLGSGVSAMYSFKGLCTPSPPAVEVVQGVKKALVDSLQALVNWNTSVLSKLVSAQVQTSPIPGTLKKIEYPSPSQDTVLYGWLKFVL